MHIKEKEQRWLYHRAFPSNGLLPTERLDDAAKIIVILQGEYAGVASGKKLPQNLLKQPPQIQLMSLGLGFILLYKR